MITALDSRVMDANAEALGVSVKTLMGNAGKAIADHISSNYPDKRIAFCCGHGNNGGDGYAAAGFLRNRNVRVFTITGMDRIKSESVREYAEQSGFRIESFEECDFDFDILVDCGLGTGLSGQLRKEYREYVEAVNRFKGLIVSVDVPTGLGTDCVIIPDETIVMHEIKEGMSECNCGRIVVADIGMPADAYLKTGPGDMLRYPVPGKDSHKGSNGKLLIIGGGPYFGAPAMAAMAALRTGADLVTVAAPESVYHEIAATSPVLMIRSLTGNHLTLKHLDTLLSLARENDAVVIGPGLGKNQETVMTVRKFVQACEKPMVIDADGLNALGSDYVFNRNTVLTPHQMEYKRLGGIGTDQDSVRGFARMHNCTILLKGRTDRISDGTRDKDNETGCAGMTGAGTGDVLAGIVGGLLSKHMCGFDAACLGAYISGKAGELAFDDYSYGLIATDIIEKIPKVLPGVKH